MDQLVEFGLRDGSSVLIEAADVRAGPVTRGGHRVGRSAEAVARAGESLEEVVGRVGPAIRSLVAELREAAEWPDEVEIEFGVKIATDANVIIARAGGEANFRIAMRWKPKRPDG